MCTGDCRQSLVLASDRELAAGLRRRQEAGCRGAPTTGSWLPAHAGNSQQTAGVQHEQITGLRPVSVSCSSLQACASDRQRLPAHTGDRLQGTGTLGDRGQATGVHQQQAVGHQLALSTGRRAMAHASNRQLAAITHRQQLAGRRCVPMPGGRPLEHAAYRLQAGGSC